MRILSITLLSLLLLGTMFTGLYGQIALPAHFEVSGPILVAEQHTSTYSYVDADQFFASEGVRWQANGGQVVSSYSSTDEFGIVTYHTDIVWSGTSAGQVSFFPGSSPSGTAAMSSLEVSVVLLDTPSTPAAPILSGSTATCTTTQLSRQGNPGAYEQWFWQSDADGYSTSNSASFYTVSVSGTYYLRAQNTVTGMWSAVSSGVVVEAAVVPAIPNFEHLEESCGYVSISKPANTSTITYYWQFSPNTFDTGADNAVSTLEYHQASHIYVMLRAMNSAGCWSEGRVYDVIIEGDQQPLPEPHAPSISYSCDYADIQALVDVDGAGNSISSIFLFDDQGDLVQPTNSVGNQWRVEGNGQYELVNGSGLCRSAALSFEVSHIGVTASVDAGEDLIVMSDAAPFLLTGASPSGGSWSGAVTNGGEFYPSNQGPGYYEVTYHTVNAINGCQTSDMRIIQVLDANPIASDNYVKQYNLQKAGVTTPEAIDASQIEDVIVQTTYYDGLGRASQQVVYKGSPLGSDIIAPQLYDANGRQTKAYLPYVGHNNGDYDAGWYDQQYSFYQSQENVSHDSRPYGEQVYESSPLSRMDKEIGPGASWSSADKHINYGYDLNTTSDQVLYWNINSAGLPFASTYQSQDIYKNVIQDEEAHQVITFTDKLGRTILKRVQADETAAEWADTYYVYDDYNDLRFVLPPEAMANVSIYESASATNQEKFLNQWAFQYEYDHRGRMIAKRVPGADWVYMVYDQHDRLVLTQDGNQRLSGEWLFTKYDQLNRPIITGRYTNNTDRATLQTLVNNQTTLTESFDAGSEYLDYTNNSFPNVGAEDYLTVTYYDNYNFHHANIVDYSFQSTNSTPAYFPTVKGQVTGNITKVLDSDQWIRSVVYYDDRYRVIQQVGDNHNDGLDRVTNEYDFVGKVLTSRSSHFRPSAIVWTNQQNVSEESGVFTATSNNWNSGFSSVNILAENADGAFETVITSTKNKYIGFNTHDLSTAEEGTYYVYSTATTTQAKYQGTVKASFAALQVGDILRMEREGGIVSIYVNGDLKHQYTTPSTEAMVIDVALYNQASAGHFSSSFSIPHAESPYPLLLTGLYNVTPSGSGLIKDRNGWSSNASSVNRLERFANGWLSFEAVTTNKSLIIGLSEHDLNKSYNAINYGIYLKSDGKVLAYENAQSKGNFGSYQSGDVFKIERIGDKIYYSRNGTVFYTSLTPSTSSLIADMALNSQHGEVTNLKASFYVDFPKEQNIVIQRDFDYDHGNRLINTWHTVEEEVSWKDIVNLEESSVGFTKISGSGNGWTAGSSSEEMIPEGQQGYLRFTANGNATKRIIGLSTQDLDASWNNIEYAIYLNNGQAEIRENGSTNLLLPAEPYNDGDEFRVERKEGMIYYWHNNDLLRTSTGTDEALLVDISILTIGHTLEDVYLSNQGKVLLAHNEYNEIGELIEKNLHSEDDGTSYAQSVDYRYNIRGWLTRINESDLSETESNSAEDYFGMNLAYNETLTGLNNTPTYNGNISGMTWSHRAGLEEQSESGYAYSYDPMNRIKTADYKKKNTVWANSNSFGVNNINYDLNGNITTLSRNKADGNALDILSYDYGSGINKSNQLLSVSDAGDDSEGFKDGNTSGNDYGYDNNGNMIEDLNKDITSITYNYLNLPHTVEKEDGQRIRYVYDAAGMKLSQVTESGEKHTPDLTSSNHGWRTSFTSLDNPTGSIGGESNVQRFTATSGASNHLRQFFKLVPVANQHTKVSMKVYIPSSNTSVDGIRLYAGTKNKNYTPTPDQWTTITYEILATSNSVKMMMITQNDHKVATVGDEIYFKDFNYTSYSGKTTDYLGEFIYEDDQLQLIQHEEGRIVKDATTNSWEYHYHLKDHLGNTRTTFTTKPKEIVFNVSYEGDTDEFLLEEMDNIIDADIHDYQHPEEETNHTKTQKLTGAANSQVGSILSIPVGMGDKISAEVFAKYLPTNNQANPTAAIATLISTAFTGGTGINNELTNQAINTSFSGGSMITNPANNYTYDDQGVMAFLNVMFVPEEAESTVNTDYFAFQQISNGGTAHEQLSINDFVAPKAGYVLVYLTNEDPTYTEVYFDDLTITLNEHPVIQVDSYYPFGLTHGNGYQRISNLKNDFLFNGIERVEELDLGWDMAFYRSYDATIGRWHQIDPKASERESPYAAFGNNPLLYSDPLGDTVSTGRTKGKNFFVTASKRLRKQDRLDHMPSKGPFKKLRAAISSAYTVDNIKARIKQVLSFGKLKVIAADNAADAVGQIKDKLGSDGYVANLTIDFHVGSFGDDDFLGPSSLNALSELSQGFAGKETSCYLGQCWAGGNAALGQPDLTAKTSEILDGAAVMGNQAAASSLHFAFFSHFEGVIPESYSKNPDNKSAVGKHTLSTGTQVLGAIRTSSGTIQHRIKIKNSGKIKLKNIKR